MIGKTFGKLTVICEVKSDVKGHRKYLCSCTCGKEHVAIANNLKTGKTTQCKSCASKQRSQTGTTVNCNLDKSLYYVYSSMKWRCSNDPKYTSRGITVCERWLDPIDGFKNFLEDMGTRPEGSSIDRINNDLGYCKENCRWTTASVQNHNKSKRKDAKTSKFIGVSFDDKGDKWVVQFQIDGVKTVARFAEEFDAATYYDNLSEDHYNDRPNKTERRDVQQSERKSGGISLCKKTNKFRVRITVKGKRINLGFYETLEQAQEVLDKAKLT